MYFYIIIFYVAYYYNILIYTSIAILMVNLFCFNHASQVAWIHIDRQMILTIHRHVIARIPRFGITYDSQKTWLLHVKGAQPEDRGYYMCQVNTNPMISQVGYLQVVGEYVFGCAVYRLKNISLLSSVLFLNYMLSYSCNGINQNYLPPRDIYVFKKNYFMKWKIIFHISGNTKIFHKKIVTFS